MSFGLRSDYESAMCCRSKKQPAEQAEHGICDDCSLKTACDEALLAYVEGEETDCFDDSTTCFDDDTEIGVCSECSHPSDCETDEQCVLEYGGDCFVCQPQ